MSRTMTTASCYWQVDSHNKWLNDVVAHCENKVTIQFPIIGDADRSIAVK